VERESAISGPRIHAAIGEWPDPSGFGPEATQLFGGTGRAVSPSASSELPRSASLATEACEWLKFLEAFEARDRVFSHRCADRFGGPYHESEPARF
jgi:hypothetical protein